MYPKYYLRILKKKERNTLRKIENSRIRDFKDVVKSKRLTIRKSKEFEKSNNLIKESKSFDFPNLINYQCIYNL